MMKKIYELTYINTNNKITVETFATKEEAQERKAIVRNLWENSNLYKKVTYYAMICGVYVK